MSPTGYTKDFQMTGDRETIHILIPIGIDAALIKFGCLERRALRDG